MKQPIPKHQMYIMILIAETAGDHKTAVRLMDEVERRDR